MVVILLSLVNLSMFCIEEDFVNWSTFFSFSLKCLNKPFLSPLLMIIEVDTSNAAEEVLFIASGNMTSDANMAVSCKDVFLERVTGRREIC